jgi:hypothetical protein
VRDAFRAVEAAERLSELLALPRSAHAPMQVAGHHGLRTPAQVTAMLREVLRPEGAEVTVPAKYLRGVRRFTNPAFRARRSYQNHGEPFSAFDVGDLLARLGELTTDLTLLTTLTLASDLLGTTLREADPLQTLLASLPVYDAYYRHGAAVALGALGAPPAAGQVMLSPDDRDGLNAYAISLGMSPCTTKERAERLRALHGTVATGLREWLDEMVNQAAAGDALTIAM